MRCGGRIWCVYTMNSHEFSWTGTDVALQCSTKDMFIRGSVVRYVHLPSGAVDTALLEDATRREAEAAKNKAK